MNTKTEQETYKINKNTTLKKEKRLEKKNKIAYHKIEQKKYTPQRINTENTVQKVEDLHGSALAQVRSTIPYYGIIISIIGFLVLLFNLHHHAVQKPIFSIRKISR
jgi:CMP-2-keto-3-deoxyoctulosonic acid synthetase